MTTLPAINPLRAGGVTTRSSGARTTGNRFGVSTTGPETATLSAAGADTVAPAGLDALLCAQEASVETARDRAARRHGQDVLKLLRVLQCALIAGEWDEAGLACLAKLASGMPPADDPRLAAVQRAIAQRVAVELARRGIR